MESIGLFAVTIVIWTACLTVTSAFGNTPKDAQLPQEVKADWNLNNAYKEATPTRERICLNGLWRWQPATESIDKIPKDNWGYFKVPAPWPGISSYIQKDCQTIFAHPSWEKERLGNVNVAWYQREITIPDNWGGRRIMIHTEYLNSYAVVYLGDVKVGEMRFPAGEVDISSYCQPGSKYTLSLYTIALPLKAVMLSYGDTNVAKQVEGRVLRRGLCGDVFLVSIPDGPSIGDVKVDTSVRKWEMKLDIALTSLEAEKSYSLRAQVMESGKLKLSATDGENEGNVKEFKSLSITNTDLDKGRFKFTCQWKPDKLWDTHTPQNKYDVQVSLLDDKGRVIDVFAPLRFGFREFWIEGRDFYLNGKRIFCFAVPLDNPLLGAAWASYDSVMESIRRLKSFGVNLVYTHNYGCEPGSHLSFEETLKAADDAGMLVAFSQPHFGHYEWSAPDADENNGYAKHAEFYVRAAQNHPSVVMYSMSHNSLGYSEDQNPDLIDGINVPTEPWAARNRGLAGRAEAIVSKLDPSRIVYHHSSGNFGTMHTLNCYLDFVPIQERSDWFEHWSKNGVKPLLLCEYGDPWGINWTTYRGWYKDERAFGSARVPWEFCMAEWNSQFLGDKCYQLSRMEIENLRFESKQWRDGKIWYRWDYPSDPVSFRSSDREEVWAMHIIDNWKAFRTWEVSSFNSWSYGVFWNLKDGVDKSRENLKVNWDDLQKPGYSPDYIDDRYLRFDLCFKEKDWIPSEAANALIRYGQPLLAYVAGKPGKFTSKDHNFYPGEAVEKQIIIINNSRQTVTCEYSWKLDIPQILEGKGEITIETGEQAKIPLKIDLPNALKPGEYKLNMIAKFDSGEVQADSFLINALEQQPVLKQEKIALFDPKGETAGMLRDIGVQFTTVDANSDLAQFDMLIVGKEALTVDGTALDIAGVRDGLRVIMFQQKPDVLEKRFGFRIQEYGLRQVFKRVPDHPILLGLEDENLRDWSGEATIVPPRLTYEMRVRYGPTVKWCGIDVTRPWRCGNYGNVATVLIEKPTCGDFLSIVDGGFNLQYSPLMEYREGKGLILLCQMDVIGRTENEPAATLLVSNIINYVSTWLPIPKRKVLYTGDPAGMEHLKQSGITVEEYNGGQIVDDCILIVSQGGGKSLSSQADDIMTWITTGGRLLAICLDMDEIQLFSKFNVNVKKAEYICAFFESAGMSSPLTGIGPADVTIREPRELSLVSGGALSMGNGILATAKDTNLVFCQLVPWQFDYKKYYNLKKSFLHTSYLMTRILGNMGAKMATPFIQRFSDPLGKDDESKPNRWLYGFYMDAPEEMDDPYRYFRW